MKHVINKQSLQLFTMNFLEFSKQKPVLYGQIIINNKSKIGSFKAEYNPYSNSTCYNYYSEAGNKGKGGFTLMKAFRLFSINELSTNPENGKSENYI